MHSWQIDGNQRNRLAVAALEQPYGHLHQSVRSRAPPSSWCTPPSLRCRTSIAPLRTSDEVGSLSQCRWRPASPERLCDTIFEMLTTVPESSVNLTGSPARTGRICEESYFHPLVTRGRPCRTAGDDHHAISDRPTVELESGRTSSRSSGTMLWRPTIGPNEDGAVLAGPAKPMNTSMPRSLCKSLAVMFRLVIQYWWTDWTFRRIFGRAPLWNVDCWTASQLTGSLDLVWDRTSRSWWSSQELDHPEGCLGLQLSLFRSICPDQPVV